MQEIEAVRGNFDAIKEKLMKQLHLIDDRFVTPAMQSSINELVAQGWYVLGQKFLDRNSKEAGNIVELIRGDEEGYDIKTIFIDREYERSGTCKVTGFVGESGEWSTKY